MLRKFLFSEQYGRNVIWLMLSGFFLKLNAKENRFGQIILPKNQYLFNLDAKTINQDYLNYENLHFVILDGPVQHMNDSRINEIKKKVNIHYVGKFDRYWNNVKYSQPLFSKTLEEHEINISRIKNSYPIFFKKYSLKRFLTTFNGLKSLNMLSNHLYKPQKYVYYGYIKPTKNHLNFFKNFINIDERKIVNFFDKRLSLEALKKNIKELCHLKELLISTNKDKNFPYINEILLFIIRNILCNYLKDKKNFIIYDGSGGGKNFNAYEMLFGNNHLYLDFGSKVGYDLVYPRSALLANSNRKSIRFICEEKFFNLEYERAYIYLDNKIDEFLAKLKFNSK